MLPTWSELHPVAVHFPVALLLVAPLFVLIAVLARQRALFAAALLLMALGTAGAWVAVATGEEAKERIEGNAKLEAAAEEHGEMAETARTIFTVLTLAYGALVIAPWALKRTPHRIAELAAHGAFLAVYAAAAVYLAQAAHKGGQLVHEPQAASQESAREGDDD